MTAAPSDLTLTLTFLERSSKNIENEISLIGAGAGAMNKQ